MLCENFWMILALVQGSRISCLQPSELAWYDWSLGWYLFLSKFGVRCRWSVFVLFLCLFIYLKKNKKLKLSYHSNNLCAIDMICFITTCNILFIIYIYWIWILESEMYQLCMIYSRDPVLAMSANTSYECNNGLDFPIDIHLDPVVFWYIMDTLFMNTISEL